MEELIKAGIEMRKAQKSFFVMQSRSLWTSKQEKIDAIEYCKKVEKRFDQLLEKAAATSTVQTLF